MENMSTFEQFLAYYNENGMFIFKLFIDHFLTSIYGVILGAVVGIPIGIWIARRKRLVAPVIAIANIIQTIPALALLAILMLAFGLGKTTVIITVFFYSLLPIIKNTYTAIKSVDEYIIDAGRGMGMTKRQQLTMIELPLSLSVIIAGIRIALVIAIGVTAIGSFIGSPSLGDVIIRGTNATDGQAIILAGAIPTALMAVIADILLGFVERLLDPVKGRKKTPIEQ